MIVIICGIVLSGMVVMFCAGVLYEMNVKETKYSARVIRPAIITINRTYRVTEYVIQDKALDIDFPETKKVR